MKITSVHERRNAKVLREYDAMPQTKTGMTNFFFQFFFGFLASFDVKNHQKSVR